MLASTNIFESSSVFQNQSWCAAGAGLSKPDSSPVLKNNKIVLCESVFSLERHTAFDSFLRREPAVRSEHTSAPQGAFVAGIPKQRVFSVPPQCRRGDCLF